MELPEVENLRNYGKNCWHCNSITLLPYECELTCPSSGFNISKRKNELIKNQRKKLSID